MKKYIKKFNTENEYKYWLNTQLKQTETEVGELEENFSSEKDLYIPINVDDYFFNDTAYGYVDIGFDDWDEYKRFPIIFFELIDNCIVIPIYLINALKMSYYDNLDTEIIIEVGSNQT